jgi:cytosine deaminase
MLVLSRQRDESVMIGDAIEVRVVDVRGEKVRLGFIAPRDVAVHRKEVYDTIRENRAAAQGTLSPPELKGLRPPAPPKMRLVPQAPVSTSDPLVRAMLEEAHFAMEDGDLPIGAAVVQGDGGGGNAAVIARGRDCRVQRGDPTAVAELECLRNAAATAATRQGVGPGTATLYCTSTPSLLGAAAAVQLGIRRVVVGASVEPPGPPGAAELFRARGVELVELNDPECAQLIARFTREHPGRWGA